MLGLAARTFASAEEFLASDCIADARCLTLDINMPGTSGPELQQELTRRGYAIPTIFITALSPQSIPGELLKHGAVECLLKPFSRQGPTDCSGRRAHKSMMRLYTTNDGVTWMGTASNVFPDLRAREGDA